MILAAPNTGLKKGTHAIPFLVLLIRRAGGI